MKLPAFLLLLLLALAPALAQEAGPNSPLADFPIDHFASTTSPADVRFLLDAPAGKRGFIGVSGGHLATADGRRFRFWGVNLAGWTKGSALLPPHHDAEVYASTVARLGINCVRFQFLDLPDTYRSRAVAARAARQPGEPTAAPGASGASAAAARSGTTTQGSRAVGGEPQRPAGLIDGSRDDTRSMDPEQLDRLDYLVYQLKQNGIYVDFNLNVGRVYKSGDGVKDYSLIGVAKAITYFDPRLIELQKEYARQLLTHRNPYTKTSYNDEPAIAIVEIVNENSVLEFWQRDWFRGNLTSEERPRYQLDLTPYYKKMLTTQYNAWLAKTYPAAILARIRSAAHVASGEDVPLLQRVEFDTAPSVRFYAEADFYTHVESSFLEEMRDYIRKDLRVKSLIIGTADHTYFIPGMPLVRTTSRFDIVDAHIYWWPPSQVSHRGQTPMVNEPLRSIEVKLTRSAIAGKPFTVSEVNEPFPSDYECEMIPLLAAYGAFQDWDGIFIYAFEPKLGDQWQPEIGDHFDISEDPVKIAELPIGALLFLRQDVAAARQTIERTYSAAQINDSMRLPLSEVPYWTPGFPLSLPLEHGSRIGCLDCAPSAKFSDAPANPIVSDTHQLSWLLSGKTGNGVVTVDTDRSTALVGFVKENNAQTSHLSADVANTFCSITLSALDDQPLSRSGTMLLTATGRAENTGMVWDARGANVTAWGTAPTRIEVVKGWLLLKNVEGALAVVVTPLDGAGRPLPALHGRLLAEGGWEIEIGQVPATTYLIKIIR